MLGGVTLFYLPAVVLSTLVVLAGTSAETGLPGAVALTVVSVLWLRVNGLVEGVVLFTVRPGTGVSGADLAGFAGMAVGLWRAWQSPRLTDGSAIRRARSTSPRRWRQWQRTVRAFHGLSATGRVPPSNG